MQGLQATTRHYNTADELTTEVTNARVWGGLHYRKSATEGLEIARKVATLSLTRFFTPKSP